MAIVYTAPKSGKVGLSVFSVGPMGVIERSKGIMPNPNTLSQQLVRQSLATQARAYSALTDQQQDAWIAAAASYRSRTRLGNSMPLTGIQLFTKVNCALLTIGESAVTSPPAMPTIDILPISALVITNTAGTIALRLSTTSAPPDGTMLRGAAPAGGGVRRCPSLRYLGTLGSPVSNFITITTQYTNHFGVPAVGDRVFVQVNANISGIEGTRLTLSARVPAAA